jgi:hypothetical protein
MNKYAFLIAIISLLNNGMFNKQEVPDFSNPVLIQGSNFGKIFQQYYKQGDWNALLRLTSEESKTKYGEMVILNYYKNMNFGYEIKLKSWNKNKNQFELNYQAKISATRCIIRMIVTVTNDTSKLILPIGFTNQNNFLYE